MLRRLALGMVLVAVFAATACGGGKETEEPAATDTPAAAAEGVIPVQVDGKTAAFAASFLAYFPNEITAHPGDEVDFTSVFTGEPHTVTLGADLDAVFDLIAQACPNGGLVDPACQEGPPEQYADQYNTLNGQLPLLIPDDPTQPLSQAAAQPCFLATGHAPTDNSACSANEQTAPAFDGTQPFYNSGWLEDQAVFSVKLADNIAPGTYHFYCLLHREEMSGTITVVDMSTPEPSAAEVQQEGEAALNDMAAKLQPEFDKLASLTPDTALAGAFTEEVPEGVIDEFGPKEISIPVGGSVTWTVIGPHSISFNAPEDARPILVKAADGTVSINEKGLMPQNSPGQPAPPPEGANAPTPDPNAPPTLIDADAWDGQGFHSSGVILSFPPQLFQYKLTFTAAGTYTYICVIHPDMEGTVKVGE